MKFVIDSKSRARGPFGQINTTVRLLEADVPQPSASPVPPPSMTVTDTLGERSPFAHLDIGDIVELS